MAGRAGRDSEAAEVILDFGAMLWRTYRYFIDNLEDNQELDEMTRKLVQERDRERLRQMTFYCFTSTCLREYIMNYFGEKRSGYCGNCRNCLTQYEEVDISREAQCILACIQANRMSYGITVIIDILRGSRGQKILNRGLDQNPEYGKLSHLSAVRLRQIIQEMSLQEYLSVSDGEYPVLMPGSRSQELTKDASLTMKLVKEQEENGKQTGGQALSDRKKKSAAVALSEKDSELFENLRRFRREIAREENVPPYLIFSDRTLVDMCVKKPQNQEQMLQVSGVGEFKLEKYGEAFLKQING